VDSSRASTTSGAYRWYVLGILTVVYTLNYVDQGLMGLLLQPIKLDLELSDSQLGLLTGIAFALFYATLGLPIARWADRGNRALRSCYACPSRASISYSRLVSPRASAKVGACRRRTLWLEIIFRRPPIGPGQ
jgi:hypothetical protein